MCKAFLGVWREGKLWITLWGEKVIGMKTILEVCSNPGGHHGLVVFCRHEKQNPLVINADT